jgi:hypothetical protein
MAIDLYSKIETYPYYEDNSIEVIDDMEQFIQQVEILLTSPEECMLGNPRFGCSLDKFLWSLNVSGSDIKQYIEKKIDEFVIMYTPIKYDIEVNFIKGEIVDSIIIDLTIDNKKVIGFQVNP